MNRTIKDVTVKRYHYDSDDQVRAHLALFVDACNHAFRLKTLRDLTLHEVVCQAMDRGLGTAQARSVTPHLGTVGVDGAPRFH